MASNEFYEIDEAVPLPELDNKDRDLLKRPGGLSHVEKANYDKLNKSLKRLLASQPQLAVDPSYSGCPGDGNLDLVVNDVDRRNWELFAGGGSSWYDFNFDGSTDGHDLLIIEQNFGRKCRKRR